MSNSNDDEQCIICLSVPTERGLLDTCEHLYCFNCIEKWIAVDSKCPACKREIKKITEVDWTAKGKSKKRKHAGKEIHVQKKRQAVHYQQAGEGAAGPVPDIEDEFQWQFFHDIHPVQGGGHPARRDGRHQGDPFQDLMNQVYAGMNRAGARDDRSHRHASIARSQRSVAAITTGRSSAAASSSRSRSTRPGTHHDHSVSLHDYIHVSLHDYIHPFLTLTK